MLYWPLPTLHNHPTKTCVNPALYNTKSDVPGRHCCSINTSNDSSDANTNYRTENATYEFLTVHHTVYRLHAPQTTYLRMQGGQYIMQDVKTNNKKRRVKKGTPNISARTATILYAVANKPQRKARYIKYVRNKKGSLLLLPFLCSNCCGRKSRPTGGRRPHLFESLLFLCFFAES